MAKVEIKADVTVTDARGRVLTLKRPNVLAQFQLIELLGQTAENRVFLLMAVPLLYLQAIDGDVQNFANRRELDAVIQRLDDDGLTAIQAAIAEHFGPTPDAEAVAKKSQGTQD